MGDSQSQDDNKSKSTTTLSEAEWDEPSTEEDLQAIDSAFAAATSSLPKKRRSNPDDDDDTVQQDHSKTARRRLPNSVLALQHSNAFALSPCRQGFRKLRPEGSQKIEERSSRFVGEEETEGPKRKIRREMNVYSI